MNTEAELTSETGKRRIARAVVATVPLLAVAVAILAPAPKLEWLLWLTIFCLAYSPVATLLICWGTEDGIWKAILRTVGSIGVILAGGILGIALHLIFHRAIHFEPLVLWAFIGSAAGLSANLFIPWLGDACLIVADFFVSSV